MAFSTTGLAIAVVALLATNQALADRLVNWTWYGNLSAGYARSKSEVSTRSAPSPTGYFASAGSGSVGPKAFTAGLGGGYTTVLGFDADLNDLSTMDSRSATAAHPCCATTGYTVNQSVKADWLSTVGSPAGNVYATGGPAIASSRTEATVSDTYAAPSPGTLESKTRPGWVLGVGYEQALETNWTVKVDYLPVRVRDLSLSSTNLTTFSPDVRVAFKRKF